MLSEKTQPLPFSVPESDPEAPRPRKGASLGSILFVLFWMLAGLALVGTLSVFWFRELDRRQDAERRVAAVERERGVATARAEALEADIAAVEAKLVAARKELRPWRLRTARRGDALRSTRGVLALVASTRESYTDLGEALGEVDADAASVSAAASALQREVAALSAYLRRTSAGDLSKQVLRRHGDALRARADGVAAARRGLVDAEGRYGDAAELVDARFDALSRAVSALRAEISKALRR